MKTFEIILKGTKYGHLTLLTKAIHKRKALDQFREIAKKEGLNPMILKVTNIREQGVKERSRKSYNFRFTENQLSWLLYALKYIKECYSHNYSELSKATKLELKIGTKLINLIEKRITR